VNVAEARKRLNEMYLAGDLATTYVSSFMGEETLEASTFNGAKFGVVVFEQDDPALDEFFADIEMEVELINRGVFPPDGWL